MKLSIVPAGCYFKSIEQPKVDWTVYFMAELSTVQLFKCLPPAQQITNEVLNWLCYVEVRKINKTFSF
jgi:hypothetical protein